MNEFYTNATQVAIWKSEIDAENFQQAMLDAYDPYMDYDDGCPYCLLEDCVCDDEAQDAYEGREDIAMEAGLFGWDA